MMNKSVFSKVLVVVFTLMVLSGCGLPFSGSTDENTSTVSEVVSDNGSISKADDDKMKAVITDYLTNLYELPLKDCAGYSKNGTIPDSIKKYVSKETINLAEGNPEIGLHYPKVVYLNGLLVGNYEIIKNKDIPEISASFIGNNSGVYNYFVKLDLKVKCIVANDLVSFIVKDVDTASAQQLVQIEKNGEIFKANDLTQQLIRDKTFKLMDSNGSQENPIDNVKVQVSYNFELKKDDTEYKVLTSKESTAVYGYLNRMSLFNNDFMHRIPFLGIDQENGNLSISEEDIKTFEKEKSIILAFFNGLRLNLNSENIKLLTVNMNTSVEKYKDFISKIDVNTDKNTKKLLDIMDIGADYKSKFNVDSFPILTNMKKINGELSNFTVTQHISYSDQHKKYFVSFEAPVEKINGMVVGNDVVYKYNYELTLTGNNDTLKVNSIRLNEYYQK